LRTLLFNPSEIERDLEVQTTGAPTPAAAMPTPLPIRPASWLRSLSAWMAAGLVVAASVLLIGRPSIPLTSSVLSDFAAVDTSSTVVMLVACLSLLLGVTEAAVARRRASRLCAVLVIAAGAVLIGEYLLALELGGTVADVGRWLQRLRPMAGDPVAPNTALCFILIGAALVSMDYETRSGAKPSQLLALSAALVSLLALMGYFYGVQAFYAIGFAPAMPFYTALGCLVLAGAVLFARPDRGVMLLVTRDSSGGYLLRLLPAIVFGLPLLLGWLALAGERTGLYDSAFGMSVFVAINAVLFSLLIVWTAGWLDENDMRRARSEQELRARVSQQVRVADLSQRALAGVRLEALVHEAVALVAETLDVEISGLLELASDGSSFRLIAGVGWKPGIVGQAAVAAGSTTVAGYTLACRDAVIVQDLKSDSRFGPQPLLDAHGVTGGVAVPILGRGRPFGVLVAHTSRNRTFTRHDIDFLQSIGGVVATASHRVRTEEALRQSEEKFSRAFRSCPDALTVSTVADGRYIDVNESFLVASGYQRHEVVGRSTFDLGFWVDVTDRERLLRNVRERGSARNVEARFRTKSGDERIGLFSAEIVELGGEPCLVAAVGDISESKRIQEAAQEANEKLARWVGELERRTREISLLNDMGDLLQTCVTAPEACAIIVQFARQLFPNDAGALCLLGGPNNLVEAAAVWGQLPPDELVFAPGECWALRRGRLHVVTDLDSGLVCPHLGKPLTGPYFCVPMMAQGEALGVLHLRESATEAEHVDGLHEQVHEAKRRLVVTVAEHVALALANLKLRETLRTQSIRDQLTGLFNRRYMEESLERELRRGARTRRPLGLILIDLDRFKSFNDSHGHEAGDRLLRAVGHFLQKRMRGGDIACRYGGEEFVFVLPEASLDATADRAEQLRLEVKELQVMHRGRELGPITLSLGVAVFPDHGTTAVELLRAADAALYRAKAEGRDRMVVAKLLV
jgi:diguanylate cyclase (GGDEF)-like protein/PAS domain S-box-containing protein